MADYSIYFKNDEQDALILIKAIQFYYKQIGKPNEFNVSKYMKDAATKAALSEKKRLKRKGIDIIEMYREYVKKQDEMAYHLKTKTNYPEANKMIQDKMKDFDDNA